MVITPVSELDAINEILTAVGNSPTNTLDSSEDIDVINARRILKSVSREIQSRGYFFNTEVNVQLKPEIETYKVPCPESYIKFYAEGVTLIRRQGFFYNTSANTDVFPNGLTLTLIRELTFEELPEVFRKYITTRAARIFQDRFLTAAELSNILIMAENEAYAEVIDYDLVTGNYNIFTGDTFISNGIQRS